MKNYILDANLFFNMQAGLDLGQTTKDVIVNVTTYAQKLKKNKAADFFMPPRVVDEFLSFFDEEKEEFLKDFLSTIIVKSPSTAELNFPAGLFYKLVDDIRQRSYRGLRIGEEEIEAAGRLMLGGGNLNARDFQIKIGAVVKKYRERYRQATRLGFLDSVADLDLIVLARELDGFLISADEGVLNWGRLFGIKEVPLPVWRRQLQEV